MPFANFDRKLKDVGRLRQILEILIKNELGFFVEALRLKKFLPLSRTIDSTKFLKKDTQPYRMVKVMEDLGGTFVKMGQLLSIRPDLVPKEYVEAFSNLQDQVPPFPYQQVKEIVEKELGKPLKQVFASFDLTPVAAASIGQVHVAKLKSGEKVAVKVQRPNIQQTFKTDIDLMYLFVYLFEKYHKSDLVDLKEVVDEFEDYTTKELSYVNEAKNIDTFFKNMEDHAPTKVPKVYWEFTTERVLTMEFVEGKKLSELLKGNKLFNRKLIARNIVDSILKQVFVDGFFHADPHPGNILVRPNYTIAWLDFGIVGTFNDELKEKWTDLLIASISGNTDMFAKSLLSLGMVSDGVDTELFKADLQKLLSTYYGLPLKTIKLGGMLHEVISLSKKHGLKLPKDIVLLAKTVVTIEGVVQELDPELNFVEMAKPFVEEVIKKRASPKQIFAKMMKTANEFRQFISEVPRQTGELLLRVRQTEKLGEKLDTDMRTMTVEIDKSSNRIALGLLITAFLISSSLILNFAGQPIVMGIPALSLAGYMIAMFLFVILALSILREKLQP